MLKIAVCDDEKYCGEKIVSLLEESLDNYGISVYGIDTYLSGKEFVEKNNKSQEYDVIFLDINMPDINGLEVAKKIREVCPDILLVFITAFIDFALEGYKMEAVRYLLKDMLDEMFPECMEALIRKLSLQAKKIRYNFIEGEVELTVDRIRYVESNMHKLIFNVLGKKQVQYRLYGKLDDIEPELLKYDFLRIHKSFLVNSKYIVEIVNYKVYLNDGVALPIPRERYQKVKERYYEIKGDMI